MIPKKIHYCWFGNKPLPPLARKCIASWKKHCPDFEITEWNETNYDVTKNRYMYQAYKAKKWGFVSDYARKDIIYNYGGIYFDTDVEVIKPIDDLLNMAFLGTEKPGIVAGGLVTAAEPHNKIIKEMRDIYDNLSFIEDDGSLNLKTCIVYENEVLKKHGLKSVNSIQKLDGIVIYPTDYFCPKAGYGTDIKITENTYTIHHYMASWVPVNNKIKGKIYWIIKHYFGIEIAEKIRIILKR